MIESEGDEQNFESEGEMSKEGLLAALKDAQREVRAGEMRVNKLQRQVRLETQAKEHNQKEAAALEQLLFNRGVSRRQIQDWRPSNRGGSQ